MAQDTLEIEILPDGTIKTTTSKVSAANHKAADEFMAMIAKLTGGKTTKQKRKHSVSHLQNRINQQ